MQAKENAKIALIGKFSKLHDEEYIARSFESLGHTVLRIPQASEGNTIAMAIEKFQPDVLLYTKWDKPNEVLQSMAKYKGRGMVTACWLFDLYFGYVREHQIGKRSFFKSDYLFTTDDGHNHRWPAFGINHKCIRQGIYAPECWYDFDDIKYDVVFVGSENPMYQERNEIMKDLAQSYNFRWFGRRNTDEMRGEDLNRLFAKSKIVVGNSVYSPHYWSNRIVETLGRGGFLIHQEVEGLKEEYPYLVTYRQGDLEDLKAKIDYYLTHEDERREIVIKNYEWVKQNYTMDKQCAKLLSCLDITSK